MMEKRTKGIWLAIAGASFWGTSGVSVQYLFSQTTINEFWLVALRMLSAGILLLLLAKLTHQMPKQPIFKDKKARWRLIGFAFFGVSMSQLTYFAAIKYSNAPTATVIQYLAPAIIIIYTAVVKGIMPRRIDVLSIIVALIGTYLLVTNGHLNHLSLSPQACFWGLLAAIANAICTMAPGKLFNQFGTLYVTALTMLIGGICFLPVLFTVKMPALSLIDYALIIWIIICGTMFAYTLYLGSVRYISPSTAGMLSAFEPLVATVLAVGVLHTSFGPISILASCLIILATFLQVIPISKINIK